MNTPSSTYSQRSRYSLAIGAGLLLALAFPKFGIAGFAWIAPGLLLAAALGCRSADSFRIGFAGGLAFWLASLYWLLLIPVAGFPILGWVALAAYNALFQGTWVWLCWKCFYDGAPVSDSATSLLRESEPAKPGTAALFCILHSALGTFQNSPRSARLRWAFFCAVLWVSLEMIRCRLFSGFPWSLIGASQFQMTPLLQISALTGVYGVSFLVVWTSISLLCATLMLLRPQANRTTVVAEVFLPLLTVAVVFASGYHLITRAQPDERSIRLTLVQPSIPQTMIWDSSASDQRFAELLALSNRALSNATDVLLWPEAALPELNDASFAAITNLAAAHNVWFIFGADDVQYRPGSTNADDLVFYNAAWLLSPRGQIVETYHKRRLVIFGEYIPLVDWLPFIKWFTPITGSFSSGKAPTQFRLRDTGVIAAPLICFEDCFPHGVRDHVTPNTDLLVNLTNDGWFGEGAEQWQHAANAVFRAIENGIPLVRSCNNGLTCWIDAQGRIRGTLLDDHGTIYGAGFTTFSIPLKSNPRSQTFYNSHGDVFGWACLGLSALAVASSKIRRKG